MGRFRQPPRQARIHAGARQRRSLSIGSRPNRSSLQLQSRLRGVRYRRPPSLRPVRAYVYRHQRVVYTAAPVVVPASLPKQRKQQRPVRLPSRRAQLVAMVHRHHAIGIGSGRRSLTVPRPRNRLVVR